MSTSKPAARLIIKYEDDNPVHVETKKDFDVVCNWDNDAFCQLKHPSIRWMLYWSLMVNRPLCIDVYLPDYATTSSVRSNSLSAYQTILLY